MKIILILTFIAMIMGYVAWFIYLFTEMSLLRFLIGIGFGASFGYAFQAIWKDIKSL